MKTFNEFCEQYQQEKNLGKVKNFTDWYNEKILNENPEAEEGDCYFGDEDLMKLLGNSDVVDTFSQTGFLKRGIILKNVSTHSKTSKLTIVLDKNKQGVYIGTCNDGVFKVFGKMMYKENKLFNNSMGVYKVVVHSDRYDEQLARAIYTSVLESGYILISDSVQY